MRTPDPRRYADRIVFGVVCVLTFVLCLANAYQAGYDAKECKPLPSYEMRPMSQAQQVRLAKWMMRDRGVILK